MTCILQIETPNALANLEEIAAVPGVDALFLGPGDLSAACGHIGNPAHPEVQAMISDAIVRAKKIGMPMGIVGGAPELVQHYLDQGYAFAAVASDMAMMMKKANEFLTALKKVKRLQRLQRLINRKIRSLSRLLHKIRRDFVAALNLVIQPILLFYVKFNPFF